MDGRPEETVTNSIADLSIVDLEKLAAQCFDEIQNNLSKLTEVLCIGLAKPGSPQDLGLAIPATVPPNPGHGGGPSPIDLDPELSTFIRERLGRDPLYRIAALCVERFGADRAPSKSAIHRFWMRCNAPAKSGVL